jgi:hypothetical protein
MHIDLPATSPHDWYYKNLNHDNLCVAHFCYACEFRNADLLIGVQFCALIECYDTNNVSMAGQDNMSCEHFTNISMKFPYRAKLSCQSVCIFTYICSCL